MRTLLTTLNTKYVHTNIALKYLFETVKDKDVILKEYTINEPIRQNTKRYNFNRR